MINLTSKFTLFLSAIFILTVESSFAVCPAGYSSEFDLAGLGIDANDQAAYDKGITRCEDYSDDAEVIAFISNCQVHCATGGCQATIAETIQVSCYELLMRYDEDTHNYYSFAVGEVGLTCSCTIGGPPQ